jgi:voltage-gated sodium channel
MPLPTIDKYLQSSTDHAVEFDERLRSSYTKYLETHMNSFNQFQHDCELHLARHPPYTKATADSVMFNIGSFVCIVLSGVSSGYETQLRTSGQIDNPEVYWVVFLENILIALFVLETMFRVSAYRICFFFDKHNLLDILLVTMSVIETFLSAFLASGALRALRVFRVLRLLRTVRFFHELRILCHSLFNGLISLFWAMLLVLLFSFITAVFLTDQIQSHRTNNGFDPASVELASFWVDDPERFIELYFGSLDKCMLSLFQIMTLESWTNGIARPAEALVPGVMWVLVAFVFSKFILNSKFDKIYH